MAETAEIGATEAVTGTGAGADDPVPSPAAGRLSDSFSLSSSSVVLPGTASGSRAGRKRATYYHSVARIGVRVADALQHAHAQGVLHRDIKPSNLLLDTAGVVWVTDFGLAKADDQQNLTHTGDILGTLRYMAPEAFDGRTDARSDVNSLGLTLYEMLGMRPAFDEKERNRLIQQVTTGEPARLDRIKPELPRDLVTIVHKAIERDPAQRYATAGELMADLQRFLDDEPILARRQTQWERYRRWARRNPAIAVLGGVLTAFLVLATVASLIVAARMTTLARREASAAVKQRIARNDADRAREREAGERARAEAAQKAAEASRSQAMDALKQAEESFAKARSAVNAYLTAVSDDPALKAPALSPLRARLLQSALGFYQQFLRERGSDPTLRKELASVYYKVGTILPESRAESAGPAVLHRVQASLRGPRCRGAGRSRAPGRPGQGRIMDVGFRGSHRPLGKTRPPGRSPVPGRPGVCLRSIVGKRAGEGGDKAKALEFLRKALVVRERLVQLRPDDPEARVGLSASLNNIAIRLKVERNAEKLDLLRRAVEQCEAAYRLRPGDAITQQFLAYQLQNRANEANRVGEIEECLAALRRRVEVLDRRGRDNPGVPEYDTELVQGFGRYLVDALRTGRSTRSKRCRSPRGVARPDCRDHRGDHQVLRMAGILLAGSAYPRARTGQSLSRRRVGHRAGCDGGRALASAASRGRVVRPEVDADGPADQTAEDAWRLPGAPGPDGRACQGRGRGAEGWGFARTDAGRPADDPGGARGGGSPLAPRPLHPPQAGAGPPGPGPGTARCRPGRGGAGGVRRGPGREARARRGGADRRGTPDRPGAEPVLGGRPARRGGPPPGGRCGLGEGTRRPGSRAAGEPEQSPAADGPLDGADEGRRPVPFRLGLWPEARRFYRRASEVQTPVGFGHWLRYALVLAELGEVQRFQDLIRGALAERPNTESIEDEVSYAPPRAARTVRRPSVDPDAARRFVVNPRRLGWLGPLDSRVRLDPARQG